MVSSQLENLVYDHKASSVTTSRAIGHEGEVRELTPMDLALKLHYIKALYFFKCDAVQGMDIYALKKPMFEWLDPYYPVSGRIRRSENGHPFIKCNDGGVRIIEAKCSKSVDEWLGLNDRTVDNQLIKDQILGPELGFSPLVFLQFTWFTCGGLSVGLSWAHVLGDFFTASTFINLWAHKMSLNPLPRHPLTSPNYQKYQKSFSPKPISLKKIEPVCDTWLVPNTQKMDTHSFHVTRKVLQITENKHERTFPFLTALFWKYISKVRDYETKVVTICDKGLQPKGNKVPDNNSREVATVEADFTIENVDLLDLAKWIEENAVDERTVIEEYVKKVGGNSDFVFYGANLTFVNLEEVNLYGLELQGKKPQFASLSVSGVGEEGAVLVLPRPIEAGEAGRMVTVTLPGNQMIDLKGILSEDWGIY